MALCVPAALVASACSRQADAEPKPATVAVIDTGIDEDVPFPVAARLSVVPGEGPADDDGHGTEMASVVHAAAPEARIVAIKAVGADGTTDQRVAAGIDRARAAGADVILLALSGAEPLPRTRSAITRAGRDDVVVVVAAGNDGLDLAEHPAYPAAYDEPNLVAVAAVDRTGAVLGTSNRGPTVRARGEGVDVPTCTLGGSEATTGGTSAAAALVAGRTARLLPADAPAGPAPARPVSCR